MDVALTAPVPPPRIRVLGCTLSETGEKNGDAFRYCVRTEGALEEHLFVVADSVSSSERGPEAAESACAEVCDAFEHRTFGR